MPPRSPLVALGTAVMAIIQGATSSNTLVPSALAQAPRRPDDDGDDDPLLLTAPGIQQPMYLAHRSHRSHQSHRSHSSHYSGGHGSGWRGSYEEPAPEPPPPPPKPAVVSLVAYPGGRIFVDGKLVGTDSTATLVLASGTHEVRVVNQFVGDTNTRIFLSEGQTGMIVIQW
ncbi:hypothetical protein [Sorangium atrum]|uniref:PEGA domain-containing protein n=1 Tax=Sorangium atrum TaxID=2995308 RepID=A0ABT5CIQ2_9BACT|nr:hypothetical protein [Sorangium aterium]MDC0685720.1 hypothetical protein [Sorangium aterium]